MIRREFLKIAGAFAPVLTLFGIGKKGTAERGFDPGLCDICGKPAAYITFDLVEDLPRPGKDGQWYEASHAGNTKRGCKDHPTKESRRFPLPEEIKVAYVRYYCAAEGIPVPAFADSNNNLILQPDEERNITGICGLSLPKEEIYKRWFAVG